MQRKIFHKYLELIKAHEAAHPEDKLHIKHINNIATVLKANNQIIYPKGINNYFSLPKQKFKKVKLSKNSLQSSTSHKT